MTPDLSTIRVLRLTARFLQIVVAVVFIIAAGLKAFDPSAFADQIRLYGIFPQLSMVAAWCFIIGEGVLAFALLVNFLPRITTLLGIMLLLFFIGITVYGMVAGLSGNCGCFGNLVHRSPEQVIVEDALMVLALLFSFLVLYREKPRRSGWKLAVAGIGGAVMAIAAVASNSLPVDGLVTALKPGATFSAWPTEGLYKNLNKGTYIVFLFSLKEKSIETDIAMMNTLAQNEQLPPSIGLLTDGASSLTQLTFEYAPAFASGAIEPRFARSLYRTLPRTFVLENGVVREVWSRIPIPHEVSMSLSRLRIAVPAQR
jgi:hypothetical protein